MTIYNVIAFLGIAAVAAWTFRPRGTRAWFAWTLLPLVVLALNLAWRGWRVSLQAPDLIDIAFAGGTILVLWATASRRSELLWRAAARFVASVRWGRDERFQFDNHVHDVLHPLRPLLRAVPPQSIDPAWRRQAAASRSHAIETLVALHPPTAEWAEVRDRYVDLVRAELETTLAGPSPMDIERQRALRAAVSARVLELRAAYGAGPHARR